MRNAFRACAVCLALGVSIAASPASHAARTNEPDAIDGKIRETRVIGGVRYATVTVGSDDGVTRGTKLCVYGGRTGRDVLGTVEITVVEPEEAMGRVTGPKVADVRENDRVRSEEKAPSPPPRIVPATVPSAR
jgi:hypothetical protein